MSDQYEPPKVWQWDQENGGAFANINRPTAGARHEKDLPVGDHPFQLYSLATPNGVKVTIMFEELLAAGFDEAEYDAWHISIHDGDQFSSGFVDINPNSKIPALMDRKDNRRVFESGAILLYLAEKFGTFLPTSLRTEVLNWLFWQMGSAPYLGGGFGHFYSYAPSKIKYCIDRFTMEVKRQLDVLDKQLEKGPFITGAEYTIADVAIWPWYGALVMNRIYNAAEFIEANSYVNVERWARLVSDRPAVQRGVAVNRSFGAESGQMKERHSSDDFLGVDLRLG